MSDVEPGTEENPTSDDTTGTLKTGQSSTQDQDQETRQWAMFIHFSILACWVIPIAGLIVPILLWQLKKDELPGIVPHAHIVMNWMLTSLVYACICFILTFILIGVLGFIALAIATLVFSIIGGVKANSGEVWEYPGTFIKVFK